MKFHVDEIEKGVYGELSKIKEELEEAYDAEKQGIRLMLLIELSDIIGAVKGVADKHGVSLDDLIKFAEVRSRVAKEEEASARILENARKPEIPDLPNFRELEDGRIIKGESEEEPRRGASCIY
jgi:phosphoribosyl-ATP pyrophosphohydrolase